MKIYFAGSGGKVRNEMLTKFLCDRLFSYYIIIDEYSGYGERERGLRN